MQNERLKYGGLFPSPPFIIFFLYLVYVPFSLNGVILRPNFWTEQPKSSILKLHDWFNSYGDAKGFIPNTWILPSEASSSVYTTKNEVDSKVTITLGVCISKHSGFA